MEYIIRLILRGRVYQLMLINECFKTDGMLQVNTAMNHWCRNQKIAKTCADYRQASAVDVPETGFVNV
jgi:hypothetical protein